MKNNKNRLDYQAHLSRHSHDTSAGYSFSLAPGFILPVYFDILGPSDTVYMKSNIFGRLKDVVTAFRGEIDVNLDYFFVPLQMIYTPFGQIFSQTDDFMSSLYSNMSATTSFPVINADISNAQRPDYMNYEVGECYGKMLFRLYDALNLNPRGIAKLQATSESDVPIENPYNVNPRIAPWIPCAYQAIYQKYFRNDEFERLNVHAFNVDSLFDTSSPTWKMLYFTGHLCQRPNDYFTSTRVSPLASAVNQLREADDVLPINGGVLDDNLTLVRNYLSGSDVSLSNEMGDSEPEHKSFTTTDLLGGNGIADGIPSVASIRSLFAVDKFMRIYGRADKTYDDQILAHFGVKIPHDVKHDLTHIKHYHCVLMADPIYSSNTTINANSDVITALGQVGGQGSVDYKSSQEKFVAPVHGVLMAVMYVTVKPRYYDTFSKLHFCSNRLDFPIPEFDKLGAQPLYCYEFMTGQFGSTDISKIKGWQNRYQQFKKKYNRVSLTFMNTYEYEAGENVYAPWFVSRNAFTPCDSEQPPQDYSDDDFVPSYAFFESPYVLNGVMVTRFSGNWSRNFRTSPWLTLQSDPLVFDYFMDCKKVSWMSETGEPEF